MTTVKITQLPAITGANADAADVLPLVDVSLNTTNKITRQEFFNNIPSATVVGDFFIADKIVHNGDTNTSIRFPAADTVTVETSGAERLRITSDGNVGIGTSPSNFAGYSTLSLNNTSGSIVNLFVNGTETGRLQAYSGVLALVTTNASSLMFSTNNSERVRIDSSGNVGIGTSSPNKSGFTRALTVNTTGNFGLEFTRNDVVQTLLRQEGTGEFRISNSVSQPIHLETGGYVYASTGGAERMRITAAGNVGIGNTAPVVPLHVTGATMTTGVVYRNQPAQTSIAAAATLTIAQLLTGIIQYTGAAANLTLPTGTGIEGGLPATFPTNMSFDFSIINTGSGTATVVTNTGLTTVGGLTVAAGASGMFRVRKTATNTFTVYRIS